MYKISDTGEDFRIGKPRRKASVIVPYGKNSQDIAIRCAKALNSNSLQAVMLMYNNGDVGITGEQTEESAVQAMTDILVDISNRKLKGITGVYRVTIHESVVRRNSPTPFQPSTNSQEETCPAWSTTSQPSG